METILAFIMGSFFGAGVVLAFRKPTEIKLPPLPTYKYTKTTTKYQKPKRGNK